MREEYKILSPCKINLNLLVHKKRDDGYHNLTSIFQLVDLMDEIRLDIDAGDSITVLGDFDCREEDNLIYKALFKFKELTKIKRRFRVRVDKRIPQGGGLGGGSGNCGAVLRFLGERFNNLISRDELFNLALDIGSDVPFFLYYPTALVTGRGENLRELITVEDYYILLINPGVHISTSFAFQELYSADVITEFDINKAEELIRYYKKGVNYFTNFKNSFEIAMYSDYTFINEIKTVLTKSGATYASMSGSGSTMFGIFTRLDDALKAEKVLQAFNYNINLVKPLSSFPDYIRI